MSAIPQSTGGTASAPRRAAPEARDLVLRFSGSGAEYFRIWIVNICLSLLTLGIFSAWAKVRKKRYFYSHTTLDGTPFQYLGQPIPILKGRIVATIVFGAWYLGTHYFHKLLPIVAILLIALAPWVLVRSAAFNARYSAYRNMTFEFKGTYWSAAKVLYGWGLLALLTLGIGFSWWQQRIKQYMVTRTSYGGVNAEFAATGGQFFRIYALSGLIFGGVMVGLVVVLGIFVGARVRSPEDLESLSSMIIVFTVLVYVVYAIAFAYIQTRIGNLVWNSTQLGPIKFQSSLRAPDLIWLYVTNALAILISAGLLIPWAVVRMHKYRAEHLTLSLDGFLEYFEGNPASNVQAAGAEVGEFFDFDMSI